MKRRYMILSAIVALVAAHCASHPAAAMPVQGSPERIIFLSGSTATLAASLSEGENAASSGEWGAQTAIELDDWQFIPFFGGWYQFVLSAYYPQGGKGSPTAADSITSGPPYASTHLIDTKVSAALQANGMMPVLKAMAEDNGGTGIYNIFSWSLAVEGYTYNGSDPKQFELDVALDGSIAYGNSPPPPPDPYNHMGALVGVWDSTNFSYPMHPIDLFYENRATPLTSRLNFYQDTEGSVSWTPGPVQFQVNPGQTFYLGAYLFAQAQTEGSADAYDTLSLQFDSYDGLTPASTAPEEGAAIPEPATMSLLASSLLGLWAIRKKARR